MSHTSRERNRRGNEEGRSTSLASALGFDCQIMYDSPFIDSDSHL